MTTKALLLVALASCTHDVTVVDRAEVATARELDILYVLDNSSDNGRYDAMAAQLDDLRARLSDVDGELPSLHVGVVTTDLGARGTDDAAPGPAVGGCAGDGDAGQLKAMIEDLRGPDGTRVRNFAGDSLEDELARVTNPGPGSGCEFEQPLEAMRRALDPATNPGFVRDGAMLQVVFLTNEDDCSLKTAAMLDPANEALGPLSSFRCTEQGVVCDQPDPRRPGLKTNCRPREGSPFMVDVSAYEAFLLEAKPSRKDVIVSAVVGANAPFRVRDIGVPTLAPSCEGPAGTAKPAVRLGSLVDAFDGVLVDACTQGAAYERISAPIVERQRACFANLRIDDGEACTVFEILGDAETELPRCADGGAAPCWTIETDTAACPAGDHLRIHVDRGTTPAPANARVQANCVVKERNP